MVIRFDLFKRRLELDMSNNVCLVNDKRSYTKPRLKAGFCNKKEVTYHCACYLESESLKLWSKDFMKSIDLATRWYRLSIILPPIPPISAKTNMRRIRKIRPRFSMQ